MYLNYVYFRYIAKSDFGILRDQILRVHMPQAICTLLAWRFVYLHFYININPFNGEVYVYNNSYYFERKRLNNINFNQLRRYGRFDVWFDFIDTLQNLSEYPFCEDTCWIPLLDDRLTKTMNVF